MRLNICIALLCVFGCSRSDRDTPLTSRSAVATVASGTSSTASTETVRCDSIVPGTYTNLRTSSVTGDFGGFEITIACAKGVYTAGVIVAEGVPEPPVNAPAEVHDTTVLIELPRESSLGAMENFRGYVSGRRLHGRFGNDVGVNLPRLP
jgi:hypothetical protein